MAIRWIQLVSERLGAPYLYEPKNWLRLVTGMSSGIVLGFALCFLTASSVWKRSTRAARRWSTARDGLDRLFWTPIGLAIMSDGVRCTCR